MQGNNPKEAIKRQATIREEIRQADDEWNELDGLYKNEARKRKSKFTQEQLDVQQTLVQRLYAELEKVKELQKMGFAARGNNRDTIAANLNTQALTTIDFDADSGKYRCIVAILLSNHASYTDNDEFIPNQSSNLSKIRS